MIPTSPSFEYFDSASSKREETRRERKGLYFKGKTAGAPSTFDYGTAGSWDLDYNILMNRNNFYSYGANPGTLQYQPNYFFTKYNNFSLFTLFGN